jgi:hypothetical protein
MAPLVIPGTVQVAIEMSCSGQPVWHVVHIFIDEGLDTPATTLADVKTAWEASGGPLKQHSDAVTMVGYHYTDLRFPDGSVAFLGSSTAGLGTQSLSTMAACALVKLSSGTRDRSKNGRLYHGPLAEGDIAANGRTIEGTKLTSLATAYNQFRTAINVGSRKWVIASRKNLTSFPIESVSVASIVATQRRRLR